MVLLGGLGTVFGPIVGAVIVIVVESYLAQLGGWVTVVQGALFVVCVLAFRRGIIGELSRVLHRPLWKVEPAAAVEASTGTRRARCLQSTPERAGRPTPAPRDRRVDVAASATPEGSV